MDFQSVNQMILSDGKGIQEGVIWRIRLKILKIVSKLMEPLYKSLAYTLNPALQELLEI